MTREELDNLFYKVPNGVDYADLLEEVDLEDVPEETINKLISLLSSDDDFLRYKASRLLTIWGLKEGFDVLTQMFVEGKLEGYIPHRLYSYDDTNRIILDALTSYWANQSDIGNGDKARQDIFPYVCKIIEQAEKGYYDLSYFYYVPNGVDYADLLEEVDLEDVPEETINKLISLLSSDDDFLRYKASRLLTIWGLKEGFDVLTQMFVEGKLEGYIPHRLYSYDDTNRIILDALTSYWANQSDIGNGDKARQDIFPYVCKIIEQAEKGYYDLSYFYYLVEDNGFSEYIPYLKHFLSVIMDKPEDNYWRIHDTLKLFLEIEPDYVEKLLEEKSKSLADFGLEEENEGN